MGKIKGTLAPGDAFKWEMLKLMKMMMSENQLSQSQVHVSVFRGLRVKHLKASLNRRPIAYTWGEVLTQHHSRNTETDDQHNTCDGSSD